MALATNKEEFPSELILTPAQAAAILELLLAYRREGRVPRAPMRTVRHLRH